jgi:hypothetical protein
VAHSPRGRGTRASTLITFAIRPSRATIAEISILPPFSRRRNRHDSPPTEFSQLKKFGDRAFE